MNVLGGCATPPLSAATTAADASVPAASEPAAASAAAPGNTAPEPADGPSTAVSFQRLLSKAADAPAPPANDAPLMDTNVTTAFIAVAADDTNAIATTAATNPLTQLLQLVTQPVAATAAPVAATAGAGAANSRSTNKDDETNGVAQDESLALLLASMTQLGLAQPPVPTDAATTAAAAADTAGTIAAVSSGGIAARLLSATDRTGSAEGVLARLRPGMSASLAAANSDAVDSNAANAGVPRTEFAAPGFAVRELLGGAAEDAASRPRDQNDTPAARGADGAGIAPPAGAEPTRVADPVVRTISLPVQHARWSEAISTEIRWFAEQGVQSATLRLTPEHLGPVEVRLSLDSGQVNVNFSAAHADTRAALEQSLPRLREMLAGAGLSLGEAQVQQQMRQGSQNSFNPGSRTADTEVRDTLIRLPMRLGLVDEYA